MADVQIFGLKNSHATRAARGFSGSGARRFTSSIWASGYERREGGFPRRKDVTEEDRARLNGGVARILAKGALSREDIVRDVERVLRVAGQGSGPG